jgi:hypothetical protein
MLFMWVHSDVIASTSLASSLQKALLNAGHPGNGLGPVIIQSWSANSYTLVLVFQANYLTSLDPITLSVSEGHNLIFFVAKWIKCYGKYKILNTV